MTGRVPPRLPPVRSPGSRVVPAAPHLARSFRVLEQRLSDLARIIRPQELQVVDASVTNGKPVTSGSYVDVFRMWAYRQGANVYADVVLGAGASSVIAAQITCPILGVTGSNVTSPAGGEWLGRLTLSYPDTWPPGTALWAVVQARRVSGTDTTTLQVARAWQR